jgi:general secretion pathway protein F
MQRFHLHVVQGREAPRTLDLLAESAALASSAAVRQGYSVLSVQAVRSDSFTLPRLRFGTRQRPFDVPVFAEQLRDLLAAGLSVIEAALTLRSAKEGDDAGTLDGLIHSMRNGEPLSQALADQGCFPALLVALVRASEQTSDLPQALSRYLEHHARVSELRHRLSAIAIYPAVLVVVSTLVLAFLLLYVMPKFARVFEGMTGDLPWSARAMIWWSQWLQGYGPWVLGLLAAAAIAVLSFVLSGSLLERLQSLALSIPGVRPQLRILVLARWYRATGMLVEGGFPLPEALGLANELLPKSFLDRGTAVQSALRDGLSPATAYAAQGMATPIAAQLILAGERTGGMGAVLTRTAQFHEAETTRWLERSMRTLEPVVMALMGLGIGIVVVLMYMPIFELASSIQ